MTAPKHDAPRPDTGAGTNHLLHFDYTKCSLVELIEVDDVEDAIERLNHYDRNGLEADRVESAA